jgi:hypothetical protein
MIAGKNAVRETLKKYLEDSWRLKKDDLLKEGEKKLLDFFGIIVIGESADGWL